MRDSIKKFAPLNWVGIDDTLEDYEARISHIPTNSLASSREKGS